MAYRGDDSLRNRIDELAERNTEGELTDEERAEYEGVCVREQICGDVAGEGTKATGRRLTRHG